MTWIRRGRGPRRRPPGGWESLTPTELEVVHRAAGGATNREIAGAMFVTPAPSRRTCRTSTRSSAFATASSSLPWRPGATDGPDPGDIARSADVLARGGAYGRDMRSRSIAILASAALAVLVTAAPADASSWFNVSFLYEPTTRVPGAPSGAHVLIVYSDPGEANRKPKVARRVQIVYPKGTRIDTSARPECHATDAELRKRGRAACPADTQLGVGQAEVTSGVGPPQEHDEATFNAPGNFVEVLTLAGTDQVVAVVREHLRGRVATTDTEPSCVPPGQPPGCAPFGEFAVTRFEVFAPPRGIPVTRSTLTMPRKCPRVGFWRFEMRFRFADGSRERRYSYARCKRTSNRKSSGRREKPRP